MIRKEVRGFISLNAQNIKALQVKDAQQHLSHLKAAHKRVHKFHVLVKFYNIITALKKMVDVEVEKYRQRKRLERYASFIKWQYINRNKRYQGLANKMKN